jgi:hypothetical protein
MASISNMPEAFIGWNKLRRVEKNGKEYLFGKVIMHR